MLKGQLFDGFGGTKCSMEKQHLKPRGFGCTKRRITSFVYPTLPRCQVGEFDQQLRGHDHSIGIPGCSAEPL